MNKLRAIITSLFFLILFCGGIEAQLDFVASGGEASGFGGSSSYSVGQVNYINIDAEAGFISLGVQQPNLFLTVDVTEPVIEVFASAYPNPANNTVHLQLENGQHSAIDTKELYYELYDAEGKILMRNKIESSVTNVQIEALSNAIYFLRVTQYNNVIKTFKIFKSN